MTRALSFTVLVVLDRDVAARAGRSIVEQSLRALDARGASSAAFLVRMKDRPAEESADNVRALLPACSARRAPLLVHTFVEVARDEGAHGVHLASSGDPRAARAALGDDALVGWSRHAGDALDDARLRACTYVTLSPFARPRSKPDDARAVLGDEGLARAVRRAAVPVVAQGGISEANALVARRAGASAIAVLERVCGAPDPARALDDVVDAWDGVAARRD